MTITKQKKLTPIQQASIIARTIKTSIHLCMGLLIAISSFNLQADGVTEAARLQNKIDELSAPLMNPTSIFALSDPSPCPDPTEWSDFMLNRMFPFVESMYYDGIMMAQDTTTTEQHASNVQLLQTLINQYKKMVLLITDALLLVKPTDTGSRKSSAFVEEHTLKNNIHMLEQMLAEYRTILPRNGNSWAQALLASSIATVNTIAEKIIGDYRQLNP